MKPDKLEIIVKLVAYTLVAAGISVGNSLAQWANIPERPNTIQWVIIVGAVLAAVGNQWLAFMSGSWRSYQEGKTNGNGNKPTT